MGNSTCGERIQVGSLDWEKVITFYILIVMVHCYICLNSLKLLCLFTCSFPLCIFSYEDAARVVHVPTKVRALNGIIIKSVALGSEHSVAVTGTDPRFLNTCCYFFVF